jgi:hypothetical protein
MARVIKTNNVHLRKGGGSSPILSNGVYMDSPPTRPHSGDSFEARRTPRRGVFSGESVRGRFSRDPGPAAIDMPERLRTFNLPRVLPGTNQKRSALCDLCVSAVNVMNFLPSSIIMLFLRK